MALKLNISQKEYEDLRALGMSKEEIVAKHSGPSTGSKIATGVANLFAKGATDTIATNVAQLANPFSAPGAVAKGQTQLDRKVQQAGAIGQTTLKQNIGAGAQLGSIATAPLSGGVPLARVGVSALQGAAAFGGQAAAENRSGGKIASQAALGGALGTGFALAGEAVAAIGKKTYQYFVPRNEREAMMLQNYKANVPFFKRISDAALGKNSGPRLTSDTAFETKGNVLGVPTKAVAGTEGSIGVQAKRAQKSLWDSLIKPQLEAVKEPVQLSSIFDKTRASIIADNPDITRQKALLDALKSITDDYIGTPTKALTELQDLKSSWANPVPERAYMGSYIAGAVNDVRKQLSDVARQHIYDSLPDAVRIAYIDYGNLKNLATLGRKAMSGTVLKPGGSQTLIQALIRKALTPISTVGGLTIYNVGKGVELIGRPGLNTVGQFILSLTNEEPNTVNKTGKNQLQYQRK